MTIVVFVAAFTETKAQQTKELNPGYYVVVGAYAASREDIAQKYVDVLAREGFKPSYGFNPRTQMYLVYIHYFDDLRESIKSMQQTRRETKFKDAWVRVVAGDIVKIESTQTTNVEQTVRRNTVTNEANNASQPVAGTPIVEEVKVAEDSVVVTDNEEIVQYERMTLGNTEVFLSLYHAQNNRIVEGDVQVIDTDRAKFLTKVKGNEYLLLPDPKSESGKLSLICEAFGYRKVQEDINYPVPLADTVKPHIELIGTTIVVRFDLVRYYKGDKAILYNVYFYNDAAVMAPESRYELNSLLQMMKEVPGYKIMLHGHTNGNYKGRIITMGPEKNLFSLDGSSNTVGSAKDLSRLRAEAIKEYLVSNGIGADRIAVKAWGGKRPLYDKRSVNARKNVRVEVEILEQ